MRRDTKKNRVLSYDEWLALAFLLWPVRGVEAKYSTDFAKVKNAIYTVEYSEDHRERVQFKDGVFEIRGENASPKHRFYIADDPILLTRAGTAYVVMWHSTGGTGSWATIKEVNLRPDPPSEVRSFPRIEEDRIRIKRLAIFGPYLILDVIRHGSNDPACCPSQKDTIIYPL